MSIREWLWNLPFALLASIAAAVTKIYLRARARLMEFARAVQMELAQREDVREVSRTSIAKGEVRCRASIG